MNQHTSKKKKKIKRKYKNSSWYEVLYPTYKSRCIDFKRIFEEVVPSNDKLIADYACALQREILVQGRLYASLNYICFYANIFRWETKVYVKWEDVRAINREKTAYVIPNAIQIHTENEKYFLTSLISRDKTYAMLFRLWQNALSEQPFSRADIFNLVKLCYGTGTDLSCSSGDDELITMDEKLISSTSQATNTPKTPELTIYEDGIKEIIPLMMNAEVGISEKNESEKEPIICPVNHDGRLVLKGDFNVDVDKLFDLLFTESDFFITFHKTRRNTDLIFTPWLLNSDSTKKVRIFRLNVPVNQPLGPKSCHVKESQILSNLSQPGEMYIIDAESTNYGVPYADSFYVVFHYCLLKTSSKTSSLTVHSQIMYKKSVWGLIKNFIEKNVWTGIDDSFNHLHKSLNEYCKNLKGLKKGEKLEAPNNKSNQPLEEFLENDKNEDATSQIITETLIQSQPITALNDEKRVPFRAVIFSILVVMALINFALFYQYNSFQNHFNIHKKLDNRLANRFCDRSIDCPETFCKKSSLLDWHDLIHSLSVIQQAENNLRIAKAKLIELIQRNSKMTSVTY